MPLDEASFQALFGPRPDYDYFTGAPSFDGGATAPTVGNALWFAEASLLSYLSPEEVRVRFSGAGFPRVEHFADASTHAFLAEGESGCIVVFRGTEPGDLEDWKTDLRFLLAPGETGRVHEGFARSLDAIWDDLEPRLSPCHFTGHSLGAALATLAAARWPGARSLTTFGSPRVGDKTFAASFHVPAWRFVNNSDIVPHMPPPYLPPDIHYRHVGALKYFDREGRLHDDPGLWTRLKDMAAGQHLRIEEAWQRRFTGLMIDALIDHSPVHYARLTRAHALRR